ncbi:Protein Y57G11C.48 [Aphelenchoides avenae]|nr:Protein Y57G11C.48 [Aphelenchus avenae]
MCTTPFCPALYCTALRANEIVVDEADDSTSREIFVQRQPSMLQLEERQRCEVPKGRFRCANVARMTLTDCRHHVCFDCLTERLEMSAKYDETPSCPIPRCANRLLRSEITRVLQHNPKLTETLAKVMKQLPEDPVNEDKQPENGDLRISCSIHGCDNSTKRITVPSYCTIGDLSSALMQIHRFGKDRSASSVRLFILVSNEGRPKYEELQVKTLSKKPVAEAKIRDKTHLVFDLRNQL